MHRSYLNENPGFPLASNERMEFLGDAVLGFVTADYLYRRFTELPEGELTSFRAALVRAETLAQIAKSLDLGEYILLGRGEVATGGRARLRILAQTLEALVGVIFIDQGLDVAEAFILRCIAPQLERVQREKLAKDFKSRLQELAQAQVQMTPTYRTVSAVGPDHAKVFTVEVVVGDRVLAQGDGSSKQEAQQDAARKALEEWAE